KHPLVAAHRTDAAPHLISQRLEGEPMVSRGQRAANRVGWPGGLLIFKKCFDGFLEAALEQMLVAVKGNQPARLQPRFVRQMEAINRIEKKQRPHALVKIRALMAKLLQLRRGREQLL